MFVRIVLIFREIYKQLKIEFINFGFYFFIICFTLLLPFSIKNKCIHFMIPSLQFC